MAEQPEIHRGLMNVYMDTTESSFIDGEIGKLLYRGYDIHDLAEKSTFEEIIYLVLYGELPNSAAVGRVGWFPARQPPDTQRDHHGYRRRSIGASHGRAPDRDDRPGRL